MVSAMEAELLAKAEASPAFRKMVIGLAEEAAKRNIIWTSFVSIFSTKIWNKNIFLTPTVDFSASKAVNDYRLSLVS